MRVFITGGTGLIGSAVITELLANGHEVTALARSQKSTDSLKEAGAQPVSGSLRDLEVLREQAKNADGVIHLAFSNDFTSPETIVAGVEEEAGAIRAIGEALIGSDKPFVTCSGTPAVPGTVSTEEDGLPLEGPLGGRGRSVNWALSLANQGVRSSAVRLPRTVHNEGRGGFAGILATMAQQKGVAAYPGDGEQRWPAVHAKDAAILFRLALENAKPGTSWNAVADEGDKVRDIVEAIGKALNLPVQPEPAEAFGPLGAIFSLDQPASSDITRRELNWQPVHPSLLDDLTNLHP